MKKESKTKNINLEHLHSLKKRWKVVAKFEKESNKMSGMRSEQKMGRHWFVLMVNLVRHNAKGCNCVCVRVNGKDERGWGEEKG